MAPARLALGGPVPAEALPLQTGTYPSGSNGELLKTWISGAVCRWPSRFSPAGRPSGLKELADDRRSEVKRLARRRLGCLGDFGPAVAALNDADQRQYWYAPSTGYVDQLREAVARGAKTGGRRPRSDREAFRPEEAAELYRMLWGYTDKNLQNGAD